MVWQAIIVLSQRWLTMRHIIATRPTLVMKKLIYIFYQNVDTFALFPIFSTAIDENDGEITFTFSSNR